MNQVRFDLGYDHQRYCSLEFVLRTNRRLRDRAKALGVWLDIIARIESEERRAEDGFMVLRPDQIEELRRIESEEQR